MNATARLAPARTLVCSAPSFDPCPVARTMPTPRPVSARTPGHDAETDALIDRLVATLLASFSLTEWERQVLHQAMLGRSCASTDSRTKLYDLGLRLTAQRAILGGMRLAA